MPSLSGVIDRRLLINYRADPDALAPLLPRPFEPALVNGWGIGGICMIRLTRLRPRGLPPVVGVRSENAAHRIAVEWRDGDTLRTGVFIPRRDTSSRLNTLVGGRLFPGEHHPAQFHVDERDGYHVRFASRDGSASASVSATITDSLPSSSVFGSRQEASSFFEHGSVGYSLTRDPSRLEGLMLATSTWSVEPLDVVDVSSSFFDDRERFPAGAVEFDCGLLMRHIQHSWQPQPALDCRATN